MLEFVINIVCRLVKHLGVLLAWMVRRRLA